MKYALWTLAVIVGLVVIVVIIGALLPQKHAAARYISLHQKPDPVFALISDVQAGASWRPDVLAVDMLPDVDGHTRFRERMKHAAITMEVIESRPPRRLVTFIADNKLPFGGIWIFDVTPTQDGCEVNITEGEVYNPVFRFVSRFVLGYNGTMDKYLRNLAHKFGENAQPQDGTAGAQL
jgi:hypothetical protein